MQGLEFQLSSNLTPYNSDVTNLNTKGCVGESVWVLVLYSVTFHPDLVIETDAVQNGVKQPRFYLKGVFLITYDINGGLFSGQILFYNSSVPDATCEGPQFAL